MNPDNYLKEGNDDYNSEAIKTKQIMIGIKWDDNSFFASEFSPPGFPYVAYTQHVPCVRLRRKSPAVRMLDRGWGVGLCKIKCSAKTGLSGYEPEQLCTAFNNNKSSQ